jgi:hypothetical protein
MYEKACATFSDESTFEGEGRGIENHFIWEIVEQTCSLCEVVNMLPSCSWDKPSLPPLDACGLFKSSVGVVNAMAEQRHGAEETGIGIYACQPTIFQGEDKIYPSSWSWSAIGRCVALSKPPARMIPAKHWTTAGRRGVTLVVYLN